MEPLNSNLERVYTTPAIYQGSGITPVLLPVYDDTKWASSAYLYQITTTTGMLYGQFRSKVASNTAPICELPAGFIFPGEVVLSALLLKEAGTYSAIAVVQENLNRLEVPSQFTVDANDIVIVNTPFFIVG